MQGSNPLKYGLMLLQHYILRIFEQKSEAHEIPDYVNQILILSKRTKPEVFFQFDHCNAFDAY